MKYLVFFFVAWSLSISAHAGSYTSLRTIQISKSLTEIQGRITLRSGNEVRTRIRLPKESTAVPAVLILAGFQDPTRGLDVLLPDTSVALASFEYPFYGNKRFRGMKAVRYLPEAKNLLTESMEALEVFQEVLKTHPAIHSHRISICGTSFGSVFASMAAHRWPEAFRGLILVHGFGDILATSQFLLNQKLEKKLGIFTAPASWLIARLFWLYLGSPSPESELRQLQAHQSVLLIDSEDDHQIPSKVRTSLWVSIQASKAKTKRVTLGKEHITAGNRSLISQVSETVKKWLKSSD